MNKIKDSEVNWLNIIIIENFQNCIDLSILKEISLISKLVRSKVNSTLFKRLQLVASTFDCSILSDFYNCLTYEEIGGDYDLKAKLDIERGLDIIKNASGNIKKFCTNFSLVDVERSGYYLFSIISNFNNLTACRFESCFIPYSGFAKLGESLPSLKSIVMEHVVFSKTPTDNISSNNFYLPPNLTSLGLLYCESIDTDLLLNPCEFLYKKYDNPVGKIGFTLPAISIPSLKKLAFIGNIDSDNGLNPFLEINPNLETLLYEVLNYNLIDRLNNLKCLEVLHIYGFNIDEGILSLKSIKKFKIYIEGLDDYDQIKDLYLFCPNLVNLDLVISDIENFQQFFNDSLLPTVSNLPNLKSLKLSAKGGRDINLNIKRLYSIESLILEADSIKTLNINLEDFKNLEKVEFVSYLKQINTGDLKDKFNNFENWRFKFSWSTIKGYKLL